MSKETQNQNQETVEELLETIAEAGRSLLNIAKDRIETTVNELVERGKFTTGEGKDLVDSFFEEADETKSNFEEKARDMANTLFKTVKDRTDFAGISAKRRELKDLKKRVAKLEQLVAEMNKTDKEIIITVE